MLESLILAVGARTARQFRWRDVRVLSVSLTPMLVAAECRNFSVKNDGKRRHRRLILIVLLLTPTRISLIELNVLARIAY